MAGYKQLPRLSRAEVCSLARASQNLTAVKLTLQQTNWAGAQACLVLVHQVHLTIAAIFNKAERVMLAGAAEESPEKPEDSAIAADAGESANQVEPAAPGKDEV
jgi:hypothetical protein